MTDLTKQIREYKDFDYVIYDAPPSIGFADPALIANKLDGFILLVSIFNVDRDLPKVAIKRLESLGATNLGIISNNQIKSELIQSSKDYAYKDYVDYYSIAEEESAPENTLEKESLSFKKLYKRFSKNKKVQKYFGKIKKFLKWIDR